MNIYRYIVLPALPYLPDESLRALPVHTLVASLPLTLRIFEKEFGISQWISLEGLFSLAFSPILIYYIFNKYPIFINRYSPVTFEWSYYASLMGVLMSQVCWLIGIRYEMLFPLLLTNTICLILPMLAVNLRKEGSLVNYRFKTSCTLLDILTVTQYFLTGIIIILIIPLGTASFGDDCLNDWFCSFNSAYDQKFAFMEVTFWSLSTVYGCLKMWRARELVMEQKNEETGEVKQTILERRGWKWVVKGGEKLKIN